MKHIVVVGGGFAGATLVRALVRAKDKDLQLTLVSEESYTTFNPMLAEVVGASIFPEHVVAPLREVARGARFVMGRVDAIDLDARTLSCATLAGPHVLHWDELVLALGNRARLDLIPGMREHGHVLKTVGDAMHLRNLVLRRLAQIELESDPARRAILGHFAVIGGGFSGVELAGALADALASIAHYYPRVAPELLRVSLLHDGAALLPQLPLGLGQAAASSLRARGVHVALDSGAAAIDADGIVLRSGARLPCGTTIATIGTQPNDLLAALPLASERGRLVCDAHCRVQGADGIWAIGDCAQVPLPEGGHAIPTAQFAVAQARYLARRLRGVTGAPFSHRSRGMMATVGHLKGVAEVCGVRLSGLPAWLLWRAYYLAQLPTAGRKLRVFIEWTWGMFFRPDITHFRFERSQGGDAAAPGSTHPHP